MFQIDLCCDGMQLIQNEAVQKGWQIKIKHLDDLFTQYENVHNETSHILIHII